MEMRELLEEMISIESVYPEEVELAEFLEQYLEDQGLETERIYIGDDRFCVVAERGNPEIGFYGHIDTVPVQGDWDREPFDPRVEEGRMYGLGAFDMLGGVAAFIKAATETSGDVRLILGVDEELYSRGAYQLVEEEVIDDLESLIVPEVADTDEDQSFPTAILGRRGRTVVEIQVSGEPAHGAQPEEGESAVQRTLEVVNSLEDLEIRSHQIGDETFFIRSLHSEAESLSIPENTTMEIDAHIVPPTTPESFLQRVRNVLPEYAEAELAERPNPFLQPYQTDEDQLEEILEAMESTEEVEDYETGYGLSVADENVLAQKVPILVMGPRGGNLHKPDEWVDLDSLEILTQIFQNIIEQKGEST